METAIVTVSAAIAAAGFAAALSFYSIHLWWRNQCDVLLQEAHEYRMFAFKCSVVAGDAEEKRANGKPAVHVDDATFGFGSVNDPACDEECDCKRR